MLCFVGHLIYIYTVVHECFNNHIYMMYSLEQYYGEFVSCYVEKLVELHILCGLEFV